MTQIQAQSIHRDPQLLWWILLPITVVMILTGVLRHYANILMTSPPSKADARTLREQRALIYGATLRNNYHTLSEPAFRARRDYIVQAFENGAYLKSKDEGQSGQAANPLNDPNVMEGMMGAMKSNMAMIIPNTLIMSWINAFFSGYVIMKLPFPLTIKFKSMLQAGVMTRDMDPRWMSSISWYFLCIYGLQSVFNFLLGRDAAAMMAQQMGGVMPQQTGNPFAPGQDPNKQFLAEAENLMVVEHYSVLDRVEDRLLESLVG